MQKRQKSFPFHPFLLAIFSPISLLAYNKFQVSFSVILRPVLILLLFGSFLFGVLTLILKRNVQKAAVITSVTLLLIFSYGHVFNLIEASFLASFLGRHRLVVGFFLACWLAVVFLTIRREVSQEAVRIMNIFSIILIFLPLGQLGSHYISKAIAAQNMKKASEEAGATSTTVSSKPDVYYIILDAYARPDALLEEYGIDVSPFVEEMTDLGFYYASCSQSNYGETFNSISTALNMNYMQTILDQRGIDLGGEEYFELLRRNQVRSFFENLDYQIVAFSTGYQWSEWNQADIYYEIDSTNHLRALTPFEVLVFETTIFYPFRGYYFKIFPDNFSNEINSIHSLHIETQLNLLSDLPKIAENPNPTFTFAHIIVPHPPFVFAEDGSLLEDPGYFSGEKGGAVNDVYRLEGYTHQVYFISNQIEYVISQILSRSETPPIIIIQGDHGWRDENRNKILNLYYFPDGNDVALYPTITPVNSFRVVLNTFFKQSFPLLADIANTNDGDIIQVEEIICP